MKPKTESSKELELNKFEEVKKLPNWESRDIFMKGFNTGSKETKQEILEQIKNTDELLLDVLIQVCNEGDNTIDNYCISAYENACNYLTKKGYLKSINGRRYILTEEQKIKEMK